MNTVDPLITDTASRFFADTCTHDAIQRAEDMGGAPALWAAFAQTGFPWVSLPQECGGSGGTLVDALEILRLVGYYAAPVPAAETGMLGGWLLSQADLALPEGIVTVVPGNTRDTIALNTDGSVSGVAHMVPWGRSAEQLVFLDDQQVVSVNVTDAEVQPHPSLAGEPRDTLVFNRAPAQVGAAPDSVNAISFRLRGALSRVALMAGAIEKMSQLTVTYTNERHQFGRPVAKFQAVQQHLVWAAQDAALTRMAAEVAGLGAQDGDAAFEIASAKLVANQAATRATKAAHQAHGAMGMTQEYPLHHYSRRLWTWRSEYGGVQEWARWVGDLAVGQGADGLYPLIASGSSSG